MTSYLPQSGVAPSFDGDTPEMVEQKRRMAERLYGQATNAAPLQHWTQALAQGVQGLSSGMFRNQADTSEKAGRASASDALVGALTSDDPTKAIAGGLKNPWAAQTLMPIAGSLLQRQIQSNSPDAILDRDIKKENLKILQRKENPTFGDIGVDAYGQPRKGWIDPSTQTVRPAEGEASASIGPTASGPTGEEFLKGLPQPIADQVRGIAEGRIAFPSGFALKTPYWQRMVSLVSQYDPNFDAVNYNARNKTRADFTSGKSAQNITAFNTAIQHLDTLDKSIGELNNSSYPLWNKVGNSIAYNTDPKFAASLQKFETARTAVADELTRAFRGAGGNVHDIVQWEKNINSADSPEALRAAVRQAIELLHGRIEAVGDQYNRGMGTTKSAVELLSPKAQEILARIGGKQVERLPPTTQGAPSSPSSKVDFKSLPPTARRGAIAELAKDPSPQAQEEFRQQFGDDALRDAIGFISQRRSAGGPR